MSQQQFIRGEQITFKSQFADVNGAVINPVSATLHISFDGPDGSREVAQLTMANAGGGYWTATWDSSVALPCLAEWFLASTGPTVSVDEGGFQLVANTANPTPS